VGEQWVSQGNCGAAAPLCLNGACVALTGIDTTAGYVNLTNTQGMTLGKSFSVSTWIKPMVAQTGVILNNGISGSYCASLGLSLGNPNQIWANASDGTGGGASKCEVKLLPSPQTTGTATVPLNAWNHVALTVTNGTTVVYTNGAAAGQWAGASIGPYSAIHNLWLGEEDGGQLLPFKGRIAQVQVWARTLTPAEVAQLFAQPGSVPANLAGLYGWWPINEGQGNTPSLTRRATAERAS
jgi:hypothetical protein